MRAIKYINCPKSVMNGFLIIPIRAQANNKIPIDMVGVYGYKSYPGNIIVLYVLWIGF